MLGPSVVFKNIISFYSQNNLIGVGLPPPTFINKETERVNNLPKTLLLADVKALHTPILNPLYSSTQAS